MSSSPPKKKSRHQTSLLTFLQVPNVPNNNQNSGRTVPIHSAPTANLSLSTVQLPPGPTPTDQPFTVSTVQQQPADTDQPQSSESVSITVNMYDIGNAIGKQLTDERKIEMLKQIWRPEPSYAFPGVTQANRTRRFNMDWFETRPWLSYTRILGEGAICKFCVLFGQDLKALQGGTLKAGSFCIRPFCRYKDAVSEMNKHEKNEIHRQAEELALNLQKNTENPEKNIRNILLENRRKDVEENRKYLKIPIETIIFLCRQGLPLRGHRESEDILSDASSNEGNFRETLRFRLRIGDSDLEKHLKHAHKNANFLSPQTQNEIISACGTLMTQDIVRDVGEGFFTVLADETTDVAGTKQMSFALRYVQCVDNQWIVKEEFVGFVEVVDATGEGMSKLILEQLERIGLNLSLLRGQGYDGCASMSGKYNGVQRFVIQKYPTALYFHCASHRLNLALVHSAEEPLVRNTMFTIQTCSSFFSNSSKRLQIYKRHQQVLKGEDGGSRSLLKLCPTRWIDSHKSIIVFKNLLQVTIKVLEEISDTGDKDGSAAASGLIDSITKPSFLVSLVVIEAVAALILPLSKLLQSPELDLIKANTFVLQTKDVLRVWRNNAEKEFEQLFNEALQLCSLAEVQMVLPRRTGRQTTRANFPTDDPMTYYRCAIYVPYLDHILSEMDSRFLPLDGPCAELQLLIPFFMPEDPAPFTKVLEFYKNDIQSASIFRGEVMRWFLRWKDVDRNQRPKTVLEALDDAKDRNMPNIVTLLKLFATLPVTTATSERSFSVLRRLKTYLRATMSENRLSGMAMMAVNRDRANKLDIDKVIDELATKPRKLNFILA